jgi:protein tyrosine/serine phosphatase
MQSYSTIHNLRDYGGYRTTDGSRVRSAMLFRSGQLSDAAADELAKIDTLSLRSMIDLRGDRERHEHPFQPPVNASYRLFYAQGGMEDAPHLSNRFAHMQDVAEVHAAMAGFYRQLPFIPECQAAFRVYFETLAEFDGPSLVHCFAGKDRTGFAVALLHTLLGVHADDRMADYLETNETGEARIQAGIDAMRRKHGADINEAAFREVMMVRAEYLESAFQALDDNVGGAEQYLREYLKLPDAFIYSIRKHYLD